MKKADTAVERVTDLWPGAWFITVPVSLYPFSPPGTMAGTRLIDNSSSPLPQVTEMVTTLLTHNS